jgi:Uma2 family endonuclease
MTPSMKGVEPMKHAIGQLDRRIPEPAWDVAQLFPPQGSWSEEEYLALDGNRIVEFSDGYIEVPPMPTTSHQLMVLYLYELLQAFVSRRGLGTVLVAALRVRLRPEKFREPDVVFMLKKHFRRMGEEFWEGADLIMEVVSGNKEDRRRDLVTKRKEYARAGIPEYWIVDPREERVLVLRLERKRYKIHGDFSKGQAASSVLLPGFSVDVSELFSHRLVKRNLRRPRRKP